jgi:ATP-dependent Lon protease
VAAKSKPAPEITSASDKEGTPAIVQGESTTLPAPSEDVLTNKHFTIHYGDTGYSYRSIFGAYLQGARKIVVEDPYIRREYQIRNFLNLCELVVETGTIKAIELVTSAEHDYQQQEAEGRFKSLVESLADCDVVFTYRFDAKIHDREIRTDTGWHIQLGRGLDIYQGPMTSLKIGATNYDLRPCMETKVNIFKGERA